jgi:hypothetical protein
MLKHVLIITSLAIAGCSTLKGGPEVEIESCACVMITNVSVESRDGIVTVKGFLRPRSTTVRRVDHVDVIFLDADGGVLKQVMAETNVQMYSRNSSIAPMFKVAVELEGVHSVRLNHHADKFQECGL